MFDRFAKIAVAWLLICGAGAVQAQTNVTGSIGGAVLSDESQAVEAARVTVTNLDTSIQRSMLTPADGSFRFAALPVGTYRVTAEAEGFQAARREPIQVTIGGSVRLEVSLVATGETVELETLNVVGGRVSMIDIESTESTTIITDQMLNRLPVARDLDSVALLAPGTTRSPVFGLVSFGGASVAENTYYINGMNLTNFRNGMGGSTVPFEFYREFEVKTGGYGAEFGRSTGGVVNAVSKRGGDDFRFGGGAYWEPEALRERSPNLPNLNPGFFKHQEYHGADESDSLNAHVYGSGPIVPEHLFFYALIEHTDSESYSESGPAQAGDWPAIFTNRDSSNNNFWGLKLDWHISPAHLLELTAFTDAATSNHDYSELDFQTGSLQYLGRSFADRGGENLILRYTGYFGRHLTLSALAGQSDYDRTNRSPNDDVPVTLDDRADAPNPFPTPWLNFTIGRSSDQRRMFRFDGEVDVLDHLVRFGLDYERNTTDDLTTFSGGIYWRYFDAGPDTPFPGDIPEGIDQVVRERIVETGGGFEVENTALYLEDHWNVNDRLVLYGGIRRETFDNKNAVGQTFVEMNDQWAPRLGFSWDVQGTASGKLYGTAGRYFLPMPSTVNVHLSGALLFTDDWFELIGLNPDGTPIKGQQLASFVWADGSVPDVTELLDTDLDPTYQDEFILGYQWELAPGWSLGLRGIYRDLKNAIEDVSMGRALNEYAARNGYDDFYADPFGAFVLTNPGTDAHLLFDLDYDGVYEQVVLTAADIGLPPVKRTYKALEVYFERAWADGWALQGSYTWSESRGNYEGWTESFSAQADGPIGSSFDLPELTEGAYGRLPGDRPHTLKLFGSWDFADHWQVGGNTLIQSGTPYGARGCHPQLGLAYSCTAFYDGEQLVPRGSLGHSDTVYRLDLGLQYSLPLGYRDGLLRVRLDVFNVFDSHTETGRNEMATLDTGAPNLNYLQPSGFQEPRYVRLSARVDF